MGPSACNSNKTRVDIFCSSLPQSHFMVRGFAVVFKSKMVALCCRGNFNGSFTFTTRRFANRQSSVPTSRVDEITADPVVWLRLPEFDTRHIDAACGLNFWRHLACVAAEHTPCRHFKFADFRVACGTSFFRKNIHALTVARFRFCHFIYCDD